MYTLNHPWRSQMGQGATLSVLSLLVCGFASSFVVAEPGTTQQPAEQADNALLPPPPLPQTPTSSQPSGARRIAPSPYSNWKRQAAPRPSQYQTEPKPVAAKSQQPSGPVGQVAGEVAGLGRGPAVAQVPLSPQIAPIYKTLSTAKPIAGGQIIARVGNEVVLASEVLWDVNRIIEANAAQLPPGEIEIARRELMKQYIVRKPQPGNIGFIDTKILYGKVRAAVPEENLDKVRDNLLERFESALIPRIMKFTKATSREELETVLRKQGTSVEQQRQAFLEREIAMGWLAEQINRNPEITHVDMLAYYQEHESDYEYAAKVEWDELMVRFDRFNGDRMAAKRALAAMGNEILVGKKPFADVAKEKSHGFTAAEGGRRDWTTQSSLAAKNLDAALFSLPVGAYSPIMESNLGWHIVRVVDRKTAGKKSFIEAQAEIQKRLKNIERNRQIAEYIAKLRRQTKVWTFFSGETTAEALIASGQGSVSR